MIYKVNEIFQSIQGEGIHFGKPANFIRLAGCNLKCNYCDTDFEKAVDMNETAIVDQLDFSRGMTIITGGEPTIHDLNILVKQIRKGSQIQYIAIETNGTGRTIDLDVNWVTCSPKAEAEYKISPECVPCELKYVVTETLRLSDIQKQKVPTGHVFLQIESQKEESLNRALSFQKLDPDLRIGIQAHKYLNLR